jgi:excisionase family DNA binding protein
MRNAGNPKAKPAALAVSPADGAVSAGVGRTKFYEAISSGEIPSFKIGARRLIRVATVESWLRRLEEGAAR